MKFGQVFQLSLLEKEISVENKKLVSVIITTYNRALLLQRCLDSVLAQNYKNLEIIVADDCSTDNTNEIVKKYQKKDSRIKYFKHNKNKGNAYTRNTAFRNCKGFYVAFLDDDGQWIDKNKIRNQVNIYKKTDDIKLGIVCSGIIRIKRDGKKIKEKAIKPKNLKYKVLKGGLIHNSTVLTKRKIIKQVGEFNLKISRGVDSEFFRRLIVIYNFNVFFMKDITVKYYENSKNRMSSLETCVEIGKHIEAQVFNIKVYFKFLLTKPSILIFRILMIIKLFLKYLKCKLV